MDDNKVKHFSGPQTSSVNQVDTNRNHHKSRHVLEFKFLVIRTVSRYIRQEQFDYLQVVEFTKEECGTDGTREWRIVWIDWDLRASYGVENERKK